MFEHTQCELAERLEQQRKVSSSFSSFSLPCCVRASVRFAGVSPSALTEIRCVCVFVCVCVCVWLGWGVRVCARARGVWLRVHVCKCVMLL